MDRAALVAALGGAAPTDPRARVLLDALDALDAT